LLTSRLMPIPCIRSSPTMTLAITIRIIYRHRSSASMIPRSFGSGCRLLLLLMRRSAGRERGSIRVCSRERKSRPCKRRRVGWSRRRCRFSRGLVAVPIPVPIAIAIWRFVIHSVVPTVVITVIIVVSPGGSIKKSQMGGCPKAAKGPIDTYHQLNGSCIRKQKQKTPSNEKL
jgi:hypothetical protein